MAAEQLALPLGNPVACEVCRRPLPPGAFIGPGAWAWGVENSDPGPGLPLQHRYWCPGCKQTNGMDD